jgi:hypothetical protein
VTPLSLQQISPEDASSALYMRIFIVPADYDTLAAANRVGGGAIPDSLLAAALAEDGANRGGGQAPPALLKGRTPASGAHQTPAASPAPLPTSSSDEQHAAPSPSKLAQILPFSVPDSEGSQISGTQGQSGSGLNAVGSAGDASHTLRASSAGTTPQQEAAHQLANSPQSPAPVVAVKDDQYAPAAVANPAPLTSDGSSSSGSNSNQGVVIGLATAGAVVGLAALVVAGVLVRNRVRQRQSRSLPAFKSLLAQEYERRVSSGSSLGSRSRSRDPDEGQELNPLSGAGRVGRKSRARSSSDESTSAGRSHRAKDRVVPS